MAYLFHGIGDGILGLKLKKGAATLPFFRISAESCSGFFSVQHRLG